MRDPTGTPIEFLLEASLMSLQDLELASLNRSDKLGKQVRIMLEEWIEQKAAAELARWMIENRDKLLGAAPTKITFEALLDKRRDSA